MKMRNFALATSLNFIAVTREKCFVLFFKLYLRGQKCNILMLYENYENAPKVNC